MKSVTHIGGCILNRSPNDLHGDSCDCYKIEFYACAFGASYHVQMCREWVRYMAQRVNSPTSHDKDRTRSVVETAVIHHFGASDDFLRWHFHKSRRPRSKVAIEVAGEYASLPTHFVEVVMSNRYGHIEQMIPCHEAASYAYYCPYTRKDISMQVWTGWTKSYNNVISVNQWRHRLFMNALQRACRRKEAGTLTGTCDRKLLVAMTELLTIKLNENQ